MILFNLKKKKPTRKENKKKKEKNKTRNKHKEYRIYWTNKTI